MSAETELLVRQRQPPNRRLTFQEFLEWCDEDTFAEWVDGQVILLDVTIWERNAAIVSFLLWLFNHVAGIRRVGFAYTEPFQMHLPSVPSSRSPDVFYVSAERMHLMRRLYYEGLANIVVEIVSPSSSRRDRIEKLVEYEQAGVKEYWLIDAETRTAEFRVLGPDGRYHVALSGSSGEHRSLELPGLMLRIEWLWQEPAPDLAEVIRAIEPRD